MMSLHLLSDSICMTFNSATLQWLSFGISPTPDNDKFLLEEMPHHYLSTYNSLLVSWGAATLISHCKRRVCQNSWHALFSFVANSFRKFINFASWNQDFTMIQQKIYDLINRDRKGMVASRIYDWYMLVMIIASIVPLMFIETYPLFRIIEIITVIAFIIDYLLRWSTSNIQLKKGWVSYIIYPFTPMAIIDFLSILPGLNLISPEFKLLRLTRLLKIVRLLKIFRYSDKITMFLNVLQKERHVLLSVLMLALFYIFITALVMFNAEPHINPNTGTVTFNSFFDALYWATVTLTTVGYGDLCPVTDIGRIVSMLSSLFGVAIIALPSGVITASYLEELREYRKKHETGPIEMDRLDRKNI